MASCIRKSRRIPSRRTVNPPSFGTSPGSNPGRSTRFSFLGVAQLVAHVLWEHGVGSSSLSTETIDTSPGGETGRRSRLRACRPQGHVGSIPTLGTIQIIEPRRWRNWQTRPVQTRLSIRVRVPFCAPSFFPGQLAEWSIAPVLKTEWPGEPRRERSIRSLSAIFLRISVAQLAERRSPKP